MLRYTINPDSDTPVYRQLVDQINAQIRSGALKNGAQLPTVRDMADQLHLSCGTVKRVYDCLREMGVIEMTRRRGSFVKYERQGRDSRKLQAMTAIDRMIRQLTDLQFSPAEIQIFLNLKMREWGLKWSGIRVALVTDCPELAPALERQLAAIGNVKLILCTLWQLREYPYSIDEQADVILSSVEDAQKLVPILPDRGKLIKVAFAAERGCIRALAQLAGRRVGVLCEEEGFASLVRAHLPEETAAQLRVLHAADLESLHSGDLDVLILPLHCAPGGELPDALQCLAFEYGIDAGSMIYLEERIKHIREERQLQPGLLRF